MKPRSIYTSGEYLAKHPQYHLEDSAWKCSHVMRMLTLYGLQPTTVCEVGCGAGEILRLLQQHLHGAARLDGYDISPQAIELSHKRENPNLKFFCKDFFQSNSEQRYDLILVLDVVEHVDDYVGFVKRLQPRATYFIFHIPLDLSGQAVLRGKPLIKKRTVLGHLHYFTKDTALATLEYANYRILDWCYTGSGVDKTHGALNRTARFPRMLLYKMNPDFAVRALGGYSMLVLCARDLVPDSWSDGDHESKQSDPC